MSDLDIVAAALARIDPTERATYLDQACAGNSALRRRIDVLLRTPDRAAAFVESLALEQHAAASPMTPDATMALGAPTSGEEAAAPRPHAHEPTDPGAEQDADGEVNVLVFLQPSTKPGSLGRLGHYEVLEVLGRGAFGVVVKAFDDMLHRMVAIKMMSTELAATSPARKRFLREARAAAAIRNDNVVAIHAVEEQPIPYLVMEYIPGQTLQQKLDQTGPLDVAEVLRLGQQIASGLAAAHALGLIHRDIKPSNILLENAVAPRVKITDFGLARASDDASLTQSGVIAGTPMYMAPEQAQGEAIDQRADLFSLGSVLYVLCSGRPPFRASTTLAVLKRVAEDEPRPIRDIIPEVPEWLCAIVGRLHAKDPADRFQSAKEVADLLSQHLAHLQQPTLAAAPVPIVPARQGRSRSGRGEQLKPGNSTVDLLPPVPRKRVLAVILTACLSCGVLASILWAIIWLNRDKPSVPANPGASTAMAPTLAKTPFSAEEARQHQEAWARHLGVDVEVTNSLGMKLRLIPSGEFQMGTPPEALKELVQLAEQGKALPHELRRMANEGAVHPVRLTRPFYLGSYEVTHAQFRQFVQATHYVTDAERSGKGGWSNHKGQWARRPEHIWKTPGEWELLDDEPVVHITWDDAMAFCKWLSGLEGMDYGLPTEAQWEFAARAGTIDTYPPGGLEQLSQYAWTQEQLGEPRTHRPHAVGQKMANAFGLCDMLGNVWEYCSDRFTEGPQDGQLVVDPTGPAAGTGRVLRGGAWYRSGRVFARYSVRVGSDAEPGFTDAGIGFRVAVTGNLKAKAPPAARAPLPEEPAARSARSRRRHEPGVAGRQLVQRLE